MHPIIRVVQIEKGTLDPFLGCEIEAVVTVQSEGGEPVAVAAFRKLNTARALVRADSHIQMLEDLLVHMSETIEQLERNFEQTETKANALAGREKQLIEILNGRKAQAKSMAGAAIKKLLADDPDDDELRTRLERVSRRFGGQ